MLDYTTFTEDCVDCHLDLNDCLHALVGQGYVDWDKRKECFNTNDACNAQYDCDGTCLKELRACIQNNCWWAGFYPTECDNRCMWRHVPECMKPDTDNNKRTTLWPCLKDDKQVAHVVIDWGHTTGDAKWACNAWNKGACGGKCAVKESKWGCYGKKEQPWINEQVTGITRAPGLERVDTVHIGWGHKSGDAKWACNKWHSKCDNKCEAYPVAQENQYQFRSLPGVNDMDAI